MTYRTSARRDASPVPLPAPLARAFDDQASRALRFATLRIAMVSAALGVALWLRHWAAWVVFGIIAFLQLLPGILILVFIPRSRRVQRRLEKDARRIVWVHAEPNPRSKLHLVELHDRAGDVESIYTTEALAKPAVDAMRALGALITTTAEERAAAEPRLRLAAKLVKLAEESASAEPPRLREQRANVEAFLAAWDARLERDGAAPIAADVESRVDKLLHYYHATRLGEPGRKQRSEAIDDDEKKVLDSIFARELFTDDIATLLVELNELASSPRV